MPRFSDWDGEFPTHCPVCFEQMFVWDDLREHVGRHVIEAITAKAEQALVDPVPAIEDPVGEHIPQGVLVRKPIACRHYVDPYWLMSTKGPLEEVVRAHEQRAVQEVIRFGADHAFDIHPESVWITHERDDVLGVEVIGAQWCPDPARGCDFRGGPWDGERHAMQRGPYGFPERYWRMYVPDLPAWQGNDYAAPLPVPLELRDVTYRLAGIDSMRDCWVYEVS